MEKIITASALCFFFICVISSSLLYSPSIIFFF